MDETKGRNLIIAIVLSLSALAACCVCLVSLFAIGISSGRRGVSYLPTISVMPTLSWLSPTPLPSKTPVPSITTTPSGSIPCNYGASQKVANDMTDKTIELFQINQKENVLIICKDGYEISRKLLESNIMFVPRYLVTKDSNYIVFSVDNVGVGCISEKECEALFKEQQIVQQKGGMYVYSIQKNKFTNFDNLWGTCTINAYHTMKLIEVFVVEYSHPDCMNKGGKIGTFRYDILTQVKTRIR